MKRHMKAHKKQKIKIEMENDVSESEDVSGEITNKEWKQSSCLFSITFNLFKSPFVEIYKVKYKVLNTNRS